MTIDYIKHTWSYNHKTLIVCVALFVALVVQSGLPGLYQPALFQNEVIAYERERMGLDATIEARAYELYENSREMHLEKHRQEAIQEVLHELSALSEQSPFVDYEELKAQYGY